jgi:hypothetical protein
MRSSPSCLVASRSEVHDADGSDPKGEPEGIRVVSTPARHQEPEYNELNIRIKVSYKTLLFVAVSFNVLWHVLDTLQSSSFVQSLLGS